MWLAAALLNSGYSYFWDLERDWEIQAFTGPPSGVPKHDRPEQSQGVSASLWKDALIVGDAGAGDRAATRSAMAPPVCAT